MKSFFRTLAKRVCAFVSAVISAAKVVFTSHKETTVSTEETFVSEEAPVEVVNTEKSAKRAHAITKAAAVVVSILVAYVVVMNFPLTILFVMEMVAVYKAMTWAYSKMIRA